jgi:hypothetical protein
MVCWSFHIEAVRVSMAQIFGPSSRWARRNLSSSYSAVLQTMIVHAWNTGPDCVMQLLADEHNIRDLLPHNKKITCGTKKRVITIQQKIAITCVEVQNHYWKNQLQTVKENS